jgi:patatin-like phospholipase/acyl hydrolase
MVLGLIIPSVVKFIVSSMYDRSSLDRIIQSFIGNMMIKDIILDDILVISYEYESGEPRFYTKMRAISEPLLYDVKLGDAIGASSSAPGFFDNKVIKHSLLSFKEHLIDGGVVANNPSLYAF